MESDCKGAQLHRVWERRGSFCVRAKIRKANPMSLFSDLPIDLEKRWKTPTFQVIPISFEASSYALTDAEDDL